MGTPTSRLRFKVKVDQRVAGGATPTAEQTQPTDDGHPPLSDAAQNKAEYNTAEIEIDTAEMAEMESAFDHVPIMTLDAATDGLMSNTVSAIRIGCLTRTAGHVLGPALSGNSCLCTLDLMGCHIEDDGVCALVEHFGSASIERLNLHGNRLHDDPFLWDGIVGSRLQHLKLSNNRIEHLYGLGDALKATYMSLRTLDLSGNRIRIDGAATLNCNRACAEQHTPCAGHIVQCYRSRWGGCHVPGT